MPRRKAISLDPLLDESGNELFKGNHTPTVGPSDSSDTGADMIGVGGVDNTSDRNGTGERLSVEPDLEPDADISADAVVESEDAGLGGGLDQAEEAQLGITDEDIEEIAEDPLAPER